MEVLQTFIEEFTDVADREYLLEVRLPMEQKSDGEEQMCPW